MHISGNIGACQERLFKKPFFLPYEALTVNDKNFVLIHSGLGSFQKDKKLSEYSSVGLLWNRHSLAQEYFDDVTVIFGHTPTVYYGENFKGKAVKIKTWIDVDVGAGLGLNPMLLRLDDMKEFYFDENMEIVEYECKES